MTRRLPTSVLIATALLPTLGAWGYFWIGATERWGPGLYFGAKAATALWPWVAAHWWGKPPRDTSPDRARSIRSGLALGALTAVAVVGLYLGPLAQVAADAAPRIATKVDQLGIAPYYVTFALLLSVAHSAIEEFYWRWFLYGHLRDRLARHPAAMIAASAFACHHLVVLAVYTTPLWVALGGLAVAFMGWLWCVLYRRTGSLLGSWISHVLVDLALMWVGWELIQRA